MPKAIDLTGKRFGRLVAKEPSSNRDRDGSIFWVCACDCGKTKEASANKLKTGNISSCGCLTDPEDLAGRVFTRLTVLSLSSERSSSRGAKFVCKCSCGETVTVSRSSLLQGNTKSCGCLKREDSSERLTQMKTTHGMTGSNEYHIWSSMIQRCTNPENGAYDQYGGRGISVCSRWRNSFESFYADMGPRPSVEHTLDRRDCDGNYEPGNCRWVTWDIQQNNRRNNVRVDHEGSNDTLSNIAKRSEVNYKTLWVRVRKKGMTVDEAIADIRNSQ